MGKFSHRFDFTNKGFKYFRKDDTREKTVSKKLMCFYIQKERIHFVPSGNDKKEAILV